MSQFKVVFQNTISEGFSPSDVEQNLTRPLKLDAATVKKLLSRQETVIKKGVESDVAEKYRKLLNKCGIGCDIRPMVPPPESKIGVPEAPVVEPESSSSKTPESKKGILIPEKVDIPGDQVPFYRTIWFFILTFILFSPASFIVGVTGDVYLKKKGEVYKYDNKYRWLIVFLSAVFIFKGVAYQLQQ